MRYVLRGGRLVPKEARRRRGAAPEVMPDIRPFRSPVDGSVVGSRAALREHEKRHGVRQLGNDWAGGAEHKPPGWWERRRRS